MAGQILRRHALAHRILEHRTLGDVRFEDARAEHLPGLGHAAPVLGRVLYPVQHHAGELERWVALGGDDSQGVEELIGRLKREIGGLGDDQRPRDCAERLDRQASEVRRAIDQSEVVVARSLELVRQPGPLAGRQHGLGGTQRSRGGSEVRAPLRRDDRVAERTFCRA